MKIKLEDHGIFHCPKGIWSGVCIGVEEPKQRLNRPCAKQVRIRFRVDVDEREYIVAKTFCADLRQGSELYGHLLSWFDGDFERYKDDDGQLDLDLLIGRKADLIISHGPQGDQYNHPFVNIVGIVALGGATED